MMSTSEAKNETQNNKQQPFKSFSIVDLEQAHLRVRRLSAWLIGTLWNRHGETVVVTSSDRRANNLGVGLGYCELGTEKGDFASSYVANVEDRNRKNTWHADTMNMMIDKTIQLVLGHQKRQRCALKLLVSD
jgi:hypothetical protein